MVSRSEKKSPFFFSFSFSIHSMLFVSVFSFLSFLVSDTVCACLSVCLSLLEEPDWLIHQLADTYLSAVRLDHWIIIGWMDRYHK